LNLPLFISWRYLHARRKQVFVSFITWISVLGVGIGVAALILTLSIMDGFQDNIKEKILISNPHIILMSYTSQGIKDYKYVIDIIKKNKGITNASPFVYGQGILKAGKYSSGVLVRGVTKDEVNVTSIAKYLKRGVFDFTQKKSLVLGQELARNLGVALGDEVVLISPELEISAFGQIPRWEKFKVVGITETGMFEYDSNLAYIGLDEAQSIFDLDSRVTGIGIKVDNAYNAEDYSREIDNNLGNNFLVKSWFRMNASLFGALKLEKAVMFIIMVTIILVASFGIVSSLTFMTIEKTRDIGILKAMGCSRDKIAKIFVYQGLLIGFIGILLGLILGLCSLYLLSHYDIVKLPSDIYYISRLPVHVKIWNIILVCAVAVMISLFSTLYPSRKASKLDPSKALRYE
jgi:lipoprotein-releasing system permease protein